MPFCNLHLLQILHRQNHNAQRHQNHADHPVDRVFHLVDHALKWLTAPVSAVNAMMNTLVPTAVFSS